MEPKEKGSMEKEYPEWNKKEIPTCKHWTPKCGWEDVHCWRYAVWNNVDHAKDGEKEKSK